MAGRLINVTHCKKFALRWGQEHRLGWQPTRVSKAFLDDLETKVQMTIQDAVNRHRSVGTTIKDLF